MSKIDSRLGGTAGMTDLAPVKLPLTSKPRVRAPDEGLWQFASRPGKPVYKDASNDRRVAGGPAE